jgi:hypothetical protein
MKLDGSLRSTKWRSLAPIMTAALFCTVGVGALGLSLFNHILPSDQARVTIDLSLRGHAQRPIEGAEIWLTRPQQMHLGTTDRNGKGQYTIEVPKGKLAMIEARGATFRASRELLVPNLREYAVSIAIDPSEAASGRVKIDSITREKRESRALEHYASAINSQRTEVAQQLEGQIIVTRAPAAEQPSLTAGEAKFLQQLVGAFERASKKLKYSLLSKKAHRIDLRLLKGTLLALEVRLYDTQGKIIGSRLVEATSLKPNMVNPIINEALASITRLSGEGSSSIRAKSKTTHKLLIRKRPVDEIIVYGNGQPLASISSHDNVSAQLDETLLAQGDIEIAATGRTGLMIIKRYAKRTVPREVSWTWPELRMSQAQQNPAQ